MNAKRAIEIFQQSIDDYHKTDDVDAAMPEVFSEGTIEYLLYKKNWIDTVQWHLEDLIRSPEAEDARIVELKRRIDSSNQNRTDTVEWIDDWFLNRFNSITPRPDARLNSETPAWLLDRMSILELKIYHMAEQTQRTDVSADHIEQCQKKLDVLLEQRQDMLQCLDELIEDIENGNRYMKVYRQMKMYNDTNLNPVLYSKKR